MGKPGATRIRSDGFWKKPCELGLSCIFVCHGCTQRAACCDGSAVISAYGAATAAAHEYWEVWGIVDGMLPSMGAA